jgi:hypothetical protein
MVRRLSLYASLIRSIQPDGHVPRPARGNARAVRSKTTAGNGSENSEIQKRREFNGLPGIGRSVEK